MAMFRSAEHCGQHSMRTEASSMRTSYLFEMNGRTLRRVRQCGSRQARVSAQREERAASVVQNCICASFSAGSAFVLPGRLAQVGGSQTELGPGPQA